MCQLDIFPFEFRTVEHCLVLLQSTVEPICVSFLIVPIAFGPIMSDWWKCNPTSSWFDRKDDYGFGVNLSLPLMVIIDDFPLSFLDKKAIINISIWGFHTSAVSCVSIIAIDFLFFACTLCISMLEQILLQRSVKQCLDIEAEKSLRDSVSYLPIVSKHLGRPSTTIYYIYIQIYRVTLYILLQSYKKGGRAAVFFLFSILFTFLEGRDIKKEKHWGVKIKAGANNVISRTNGFQHFILKIFL